MSANISEILLDAAAQAESEIIAMALELSDDPNANNRMKLKTFIVETNSAIKESLETGEPAEEIAIYSFQVYVVNLFLESNPLY